MITPHMSLFRSGIALCASALLIVPLVVYASPVLRSGDTVTLTEAQTVSGDFYVGAGTVTISGSIDGDLYGVGGTVTVNGDIAEDAVLMGGAAHIHGPVGDDVRLVGGDMVLASDVGGDVVVLGGVLRVLSTAHINGDLLFLGGELYMDGAVDGTLTVHAEAAHIAGSIGGDVMANTARPLELADQSTVRGDVIYSSMQQIARAPGSVVEGDVVREERAPVQDAVSIHIVPGLILLFTTLAYLLLFRRRLAPFISHTLGRPGVHALAGLGLLLLSPLVAFILMVSVVGLPLGLSLLFGYAAALVISWSLTGIVLGALIARFVEKTAAVNVKWSVIGALALGVLWHIPVVGFLITCAAMVVALGSLGVMLYRRVRK